MIIYPIIMIQSLYYNELKYLEIGWTVTGPADCWNECSESGGKCDFCGKPAGYCCSPTKPTLNGDCPSNIVEQLTSEFQGDGRHQCIMQFAPNTGKY